jgi:hypothetical protein
VVCLDQGTDGGAFVRVDGWARLDYAAADCDPEPQSFSFTPGELDAFFANLGWGVTVVDGGRYAFLFYEGTLGASSSRARRSSSWTF